MYGITLLVFWLVQPSLPSYTKVKLALGDLKVTKAVVQDDTQIMSFSTITAHVLQDLPRLGSKITFVQSSLKQNKTWEKESHRKKEI